MDANIKNDIYGSLRSSHLSHKIDQLIPQHIQHNQPIWLFFDPIGTSHVIILSSQFNLLSKSSQSLPRKDKQLTKTTYQSYLELEYQPKNILTLLLSQQQLQYVSKIKYISMDQIRLRCQANLYFQPEQLLIDIKNVIAWNQVYRAGSKRSFVHLTNFISKFLDLIVKRKFISKFYEKKNKDFQQLQKLETQFKLNVSQWPFIPKKFRQYQELKDYSPTPVNRTQTIENRLKSEKLPIQCPQNCVCYRQNLQQEKFCNYSLAQVWQSQCPNRKARIQCDHKDPIKMKNCRNAQIKKKLKKNVKPSNIHDSKQYQIQEFMAWGIDLFTRNVIYNSLPEIDLLEFTSYEKNSQKKNQFVEKTLQRSFNFLDENGYDLTKACQFIIKNGPQTMELQISSNKKNIWRAVNIQKVIKSSLQNIFTAKDVQYASSLLKNKIHCQRQFPNNNIFRVHTKGKGAKCTNLSGISRGTFIVEYFGEIYQPWRWYEREDFIKEVLKKKKLKEVIPEFYNIYLEKHKDQPLGYDILVVDPIKKGNFSSRFSHSCNPNCGTISTVSQGKYYIGMYSIKDIVFGQQFTFDYCSMTQSSYEHANSICLCGMKVCRGNYLQLSNTKMYNNLMDTNSCFHYRNSLMLKSIGIVNDQQIKICQKWNIKDGMLKALPTWLVKWTTVVLQSIQKQAEVYKLQLKQNWKTDYPWESKDQTQQEKIDKIQLYADVSKGDLINLRFQNLITTIDKINYYLQSIQDIEPPLHYQNKQRVCDILIQNKSSDSILILLQDECTNQKMKEQSILIQQFLKKIRSFDVDLKKKKTLSQSEKLEIYERKLFYFRLCCLCVGHLILCRGNNTSSNIALLADIICFYSFTHTYFAPHQYKTHTSEEIKVTLQEILGDSCNSKYSDKTKKRYTSPCVWGQMVSWFKQTIVSPEASLSQDRRGTLSYPLINSILKSTYPFEKHMRNSFLKIIRQKPASSWPPANGCQLSYKNPYKCYGTLLFQNVHNADLFNCLPDGSLLDSVLNIINSSFAQKLLLFKQVEEIVNKTPPNSSIYDILDSLKIDVNRVPPVEIKQIVIKGSKSIAKKRVKLNQKFESDIQFQKRQNKDVQNQHNDNFQDE